MSSKCVRYFARPLHCPFGTAVAGLAGLKARVKNSKSTAGRQNFVALT